jgi:hypothetical protein
MLPTSLPIPGISTSHWTSENKATFSTLRYLRASETALTRKMPDIQAASRFVLYVSAIKKETNTSETFTDFAISSWSRKDCGRGTNSIQKFLRLSEADSSVVVQLNFFANIVPLGLGER